MPRALIGLSSEKGSTLHDSGELTTTTIQAAGQSEYRWLSGGKGLVGKGQCQASFTLL